MVTSSAESERALVKAALDGFIRAIEERSLDRLAGVVAQDSDLSWIGTGESEWIVGYDALKGVLREQNEALQYIRIAVREETIHLSPDEQVAWATNRWVFRARMGGEELVLPLRCTWVAEKRDGGWVLVHSHKSVGVGT